MKKALRQCTACPYKLGIIKTLFEPCERCKEMSKEAIHDKMLCEFFEKYPEDNRTYNAAKRQTL